MSILTRVQDRSLFRFAAFDLAFSRARTAPMHHAIWTDLYELYQLFQRTIVDLERQLANHLVQTPYLVMGFASADGGTGGNRLILLGNQFAGSAFSNFQ